MTNCKKHKINDANHYKHLTPDTDCTCDVGINGPAGKKQAAVKASGNTRTDWTGSKISDIATYRKGVEHAGNYTKLHTRHGG